MSLIILLKSTLQKRNGNISETALFLTISKVRHRTRIHFISVQFEPIMIILKNKNFTKVVVGEIGTAGVGEVGGRGVLLCLPRLQNV